MSWKCASSPFSIKLLKCYINLIYHPTGIFDFFPSYSTSRKILYLDRYECHNFLNRWSLLLVLYFLTQFDSDLPIQLVCDAYPYGVRAVISYPMLTGEEKTITFVSRTLSKAESNYANLNGSMAHSSACASFISTCMDKVSHF